MDRQGYNADNTGYTGTAGNTGYTGTAGQKPMGERIKEAIPGTHEYQATHGTTGAHSTVEQAKSHIPGTDEHRMREAGVIGSGGHHTTGAHTGTNASLGERIAQNIPGTDQYEATHGMTGAHRTVEQTKAHIPGTEEHRIYEGTRTGHGTGTGGLVGTSTGQGYGSHTAHEEKSLGQKVKEVIPGTREHEAKKMAEGRY